MVGNGTASVQIDEIAEKLMLVLPDALKAHHHDIFTGYVSINNNKTPFFIRKRW